MSRVELVALEQCAEERIVCVEGRLRATTCAVSPFLAGNAKPKTSNTKAASCRKLKELYIIFGWVWLKQQRYASVRVKQASQRPVKRKTFLIC